MYQLFFHCSNLFCWVPHNWLNFVPWFFQPWRDHETKALYCRRWQRLCLMRLVLSARFRSLVSDLFKSKPCTKDLSLPPSIEGKGRRNKAEAEVQIILNEIWLPIFSCIFTSSFENSVGQDLRIRRIRMLRTALSAHFLLISLSGWKLHERQHQICQSSFLRSWNWWLFAMSSLSLHCLLFVFYFDWSKCPSPGKVWRMHGLSTFKLCVWQRVKTSLDNSQHIAFLRPTNHSNAWDPVCARKIRRGASMSGRLGHLGHFRKQILQGW